MPKALLCSLIVEYGSIKITRAMGANGNFVRPTVVYRCVGSFLRLHCRVKVAVHKLFPLEMVAMEYFRVHFATDKLDIATSMRR